MTAIAALHATIADRAKLAGTSPPKGSMIPLPGINRFTLKWVPALLIYRNV
jgi:hypothetical protein